MPRLSAHSYRGAVFHSHARISIYSSDSSSNGFNHPPSQPSHTESKSRSSAFNSRRVGGFTCSSINTRRILIGWLQTWFHLFKGINSNPQFCIMTKTQKNLFDVFFLWWISWGYSDGHSQLNHMLCVFGLSLYWTCTVKRCPCSSEAIWLETTVCPMQSWFSWFILKPKEHTIHTGK